jgi:hypothetical protein
VLAGLENLAKRYVETAAGVLELYTAMRGKPPFSGDEKA